ncbi:MAG: hypothetical protein KGQ60_10410 [Planctomycetes bacterium]|nr:hypothetical protein [Planctomycetota bacterium]
MVDSILGEDFDEIPLRGLFITFCLASFIKGLLGNSICCFRQEFWIGPTRREDEQLTFTPSGASIYG